SKMPYRMGRGTDAAVIRAPRKPVNRQIGSASEVPSEKALGRGRPTKHARVHPASYVRSRMGATTAEGAVRSGWRRPAARLVATADPLTGRRAVTGHHR